jgi:hypothetical protein
MCTAAATPGELASQVAKATCDAANRSVALGDNLAGYALYCSRGRQKGTACYLVKGVWEKFVTDDLAELLRETHQLLEHPKTRGLILIELHKARDRVKHGDHKPTWAEIGQVLSYLGGVGHMTKQNLRSVSDSVASTMSDHERALFMELCNTP